MASAPAHPLIRYIRRLATTHPAAALPDAHLLERYVCRRDESAFAALVRRHGPLVLGACRRVLADGHAAEDAFQATFLVLARKAGDLRRPEALGPWLYGVATRTALKMRGRQARRWRVERHAAPGRVVGDSDEVVWRDLRPVLDEAVAGLPERYRVPFVLHHLEGATVAEVARRLDCPPGTIAARLARAKERLRHRLTRRGVTLSAAALASALAANAVPACVPSTLLVSMAAATGEANTGAASATAAALAQGGEKAMLMTKGKVVAAVLLVLGVAVGGPLLRGPGTPPAPAVSAGESAPNPVAERSAPDVAKDFQTAEFFRRTDHPAAAWFYYDLVRRRYPGTDLAARAADRQRELQKGPAERKEAPPRRMPHAEDDTPLPSVRADDPFAPRRPTAEQLIAYLNSNARRVPVLQCDSVSMDLHTGPGAVSEPDGTEVSWDNRSAGLEGKMVVRQPHEVRAMFNLIGKAACDLGGNEQGWWLFMNTFGPPAQLQADRKDLARGTAAWPLPVGPDALVWIMGMKVYDESARVEVVVREDTIELVERATSPQGRSLRHVTVFHRDPVTAPRSQIKGYRVEDVEKRVLLLVEVREVRIDRTSGAVLPTRLELSCPAEKTRAVVRLNEPQVCAELQKERAARLFTPPVIKQPGAKP
jgi:RNA polymerase sigma factor (sigma-70 family)